MGHVGEDGDLKEERKLNVVVVWAGHLLSVLHAESVILVGRGG